MFSTIRQAIATAEYDEQTLRPLLLDAGPCGGLAGLGVVLGAVIAVIVRDRATLRSWLDAPERGVA